MAGGRKVRVREGRAELGEWPLTVRRRRLSRTVNGYPACSPPGNFSLRERMPRQQAASKQAGGQPSREDGSLASEPASQQEAGNDSRREKRPSVARFPSAVRSAFSFDPLESARHGSDVRNGSKGTLFAGTQNPQFSTRNMYSMGL